MFILEAPVLETVHSFCSVEEYMDAEPLAPFRRQFYNGELFEMAGASFNHNYIGENLSMNLSLCLRKKDYNAFRNDIRVKYFGDFDKLFAYPDFLIIHGEEKAEKKGNFEVVTNPVALVEILSYSTMNLDLAIKSHLYRNIPSVNLCVYINQYQMIIDVYRRTENNIWTVQSYTQTKDSIDFYGCPITLGQIYEKVKFE